MSPRLWWGWILVIAMAPPAASGELPPEAARLERALKTVHSLRAEFVQIRSLYLTGEDIESSGMLAFRAPQEFRLAFTSPEPQELVIDGDSLWVVMPVENQAQRYPFEPGEAGNEVFVLFGGKEQKLSEAYDIVEEEWSSYPNALRLIPRDVEAGYPMEEIRLVVGDDGFPKKLFFRETSGDHVVFNFTRVDRNPADIEDLIRLRLPPGIEIIDASPTAQGGGLPIDPQN